MPVWYGWTEHNSRAQVLISFSSSWKFHRDPSTEEVKSYRMLLCPRLSRHHQTQMEWFCRLRPCHWLPEWGAYTGTLSHHREFEPGPNASQGSPSQLAQPMHTNCLVRTVADVSTAFTTAQLVGLITSLQSFTNTSTTRWNATKWWSDASNKRAMGMWQCGLLAIYVRSCPHFSHCHCTAALFRARMSTAA